MNEMKQILEGIYSDLDLRQTITPLFISNPGIGKTKVIEQFAEEKGVKLIEIIASQILPYEVSGMAVPSHQNERMTYYDFDKINDLNDNDIIFFDELLAGQPSVLSACLTLVESRRTISGKPLPKVMIVAAANPQNQVPLPPAIKERFVYYDIKYDKQSWKEYMSKYLITDEIFSQLDVLVRNEQFASSEKNYMSPRSIEKGIKMILAGIPTPYEAKLKPILETKIANTTGEDIIIGDFTFEKDSKQSWLKIQKLIKNEANTVIKT